MTSIVIGNRIKEVAQVTGLGNITLNGPVTGFSAFSARVPTGSIVPYVLLQGASTYETGLGTLVSATELSRDTITDSSSSSGFINNQTPGTPSKVTFDGAQSVTVFLGQLANLPLLKDTEGKLVDPTPFRLTVFYDSIADMKADDGLTDGEQIIIGAAGSLGGMFQWDEADAALPDNVDTYRSDNYAVGLWKRVRPDIQGLFNGALEVDASASAGAIVDLYAGKKATYATRYARLFMDAAAGAVRVAMRWNQSALVNFISLFTAGDNSDRIQFHVPFVFPTKTNAQGVKGNSAYLDSGDAEIIIATADAADNTTAADRMVIPRVKGSYLLGSYELISDLKAIDAAKYAKANQRALVLGSADGGDIPPFYVEWFPSSSATADDSSTFRPSVGAAASGNGRWVRVAAAIDATFTSGVATPSVKNGAWFITAGSTAITDLLNEFEGQLITLQRGSADIVITHDAAKISLAGRENVTLTLDAPRLTLKSVGGVWYQIGGSTPAQAINFAPSWAGAGQRSVRDKLRDLPHLYDLVNESARGSVTDWAPYLELANATGEDFVLPKATLPLLTTATLDTAGGGLIGQGRDTILSCGNPTTTADILRIGDGTNECAGVDLRDLTIWASVARTGGYAINARFAAYAEHPTLRIGSLELYTAAGNTHKLYNGVYHDRFAQIVYNEGGEAVVSNEAFKCRGNSDQSFGVEILWDGNFRIVKATTAIRIGGACGGVYLGRMDVSECVDAILVDRTLTNAFNREIFSSHQTTLDTCSGYAVGVAADSLALWRGGLWSVNNGSASKPAINFADSTTVTCQVEMVGGIIRRSYKDGMYQKTGSLTFVGEVEQSGFRGGTPGGPGHGLVTGGSLGWLSFNGTLYANGDATRGYGIHIETGLSLARIDVTGIDLANGQGGVEHDDYPGKEIRNGVLGRANYWTGKQNFVGGIVNSGNIEGPATTTANTIGANPNASITDGGYIQVYGSTHSGAPKRAVLGAGNSGVAVTVDPTTGVTIAGDVTSAISLKQDPATGTYMLDGSGNTKTIANGANAALADGSGLIIAVNPGNGDVGVYIVGGGSAKLISSTVGTWVNPTTTPGGGTQSIQWDSVNKYRLYNNFGSSQAFVVSLLFRARAGN